MPTSFLDLPRELRDIIYGHALVSSTGFVTPILDKSSRSSRFSIHIAVEHLPITPTADSSANNNVLSLSLLRTCRQIHDETEGMIWVNTFLFPDLPTLISVVKGMGQVPSRQIRSISVWLYPRQWKALPKTFALLTSRARHGCFQDLHLNLHRREFETLISWKHFGHAREAQRYDELLASLREVSKECNFRRTVQVHRGANDGDERRLGTVRDLHLALGGRMIHDGKLLWDNYEYFGKCAEA